MSYSQKPCHGDVAYCVSNPMTPSRTFGNWRDQAVELAEHDVRRAEPEPERRLGQHEVEALIRTVQDLLPPHPRGHRLINVVRELEPADALGEACSGVLRGLQQPRNHRRLEGLEESCPLIPLDQLLLAGLEARPQDALPFSVLDLKRVQRSEQGRCLALAVGGPGPASDVVIGGSLAAVLQLGHLGGRPRQRLREPPAAQVGGLAKLAESFAECVSRLVDVRRAPRVVRRQSRPV